MRNNIAGKSLLAVLLAVAIMFAFMPAVTSFAATASKATKVTRVTPSNYKYTMRVGASKTFKYKLTPTKLTTAAKKVTWTSSNSSVATVSSSGVVKARSSGTTIIKVKAVKGGKYTTWKVTVTDGQTGATS